MKDTGFKRHVTPPSSPTSRHFPRPAAVPDHGPGRLGPQGRREEGGEGDPTAGDALLPGGLGQEWWHGGLLPAGGAAAPVLQGTKSLSWVVASSVRWDYEKTHTCFCLPASCLVRDHARVRAMHDGGYYSDAFAMS